MQMAGMISIGIEQGKTPLDQVAPFFGKMADSIEGALSGKLVPFSFQAIVGGGADDQANPNRRFVQIKPKLDYGNLEPGEAPTETVHRAIEKLNLTPDNGVTVRLTGQIPLDDQEFGTVKDGFALNSILTVLAVVFLLWLALKSGRLIIAVVPLDRGRARHDGGPGACPRRRAEPHLDRVRGAVHRHRSGFRHPAFGSLPG